MTLKSRPLKHGPSEHSPSKYNWGLYALCTKMLGEQALVGAQIWKAFADHCRKITSSAGFEDGLEQFKERRVLILSGLGVAWVLTACAGVQTSTGNVRLGPQDILQEFSGKTMMGGVNYAPGSWANYYRDDGRAFFLAPSGRALQTEWAVAGGRFCLFDIGEADKACFEVFRSGGRYQFLNEEGEEVLYAVKSVLGDVYEIEGLFKSQDQIWARQ